MAMDAQQIVDALEGNGRQLLRLSGLIGQAIATSNALSAQIVQAGNRLADGPRVGCGNPPPGDLERGTEQNYDVRAGYCFPDIANRCSGSILVDTKQVLMPIRFQDYFKRDSMIVKFDSGDGTGAQFRDLINISDIASGEFQLESNDPNIFNYRYFLFKDPSDKNLLRQASSTLDRVRLRYSIGNYYPRYAINLTGNIPGGGVVGDQELDEIQAARISAKGDFNNYSLCPSPLTFRMIPYKVKKPIFGKNTEYISVYELKKTRNPPPAVKDLNECVGVLNPLRRIDENQDDVYLYTFCTKEGTLYNGTGQTNTFGSADFPYADDFFRFSRVEQGVNVAVGVRYPDGVLVYGYDSTITTIPPFGTAMRNARGTFGFNLNQNLGYPYPDGEMHVRISQGVTDAMTNLLTNGAALDAKELTINRAGVRLDQLPNIKNAVIGGMIYIRMMEKLKPQIILGGKMNHNHTNHATRNRRRRHNKSVSRKSKMTRTNRRGKARSRGRAMFMLKTAKQQFHGGYSTPIIGGVVDGYGGSPAPMSMQTL